MPNPDARTAAASQALARLLDLVAMLRSPQGCPWDRDQTLRSLAPFVLEEAYEVVDAIERHDMAGLRDEVGDHVFEAVFLACIASESGAFDLAGALDAVTAKLVRRHPHVFQDDGRLHDDTSRARAPSAEAALARWDAQKAQERQDAGLPPAGLTGIARGQPALLRAHKIGKRAAAAGFDWARPLDVAEKVDEELREVREVLSAEVPDRGRLEEEVGDLLFAAANLARRAGVEPEAALRKATDKFAARYSVMERRVADSGRSLPDLTPGELEAVWQAVKADVSSPDTTVSTSSE